MRCKYGFCIVCDKEIAKRCSGCDARKPTEDYTEVQLQWSNGSKMQMACCVECSRDAIWKADKAALTRAVQEAWDAEHGSYDPAVVIV